MDEINILGARLPPKPFFMMPCPKCGKHEIPFPFPNGARTYGHFMIEDKHPFVHEPDNSKPSTKFTEVCSVSYEDFNMELNFKAINIAKMLVFFPTSPVAAVFANALMEKARKEGWKLLG